MTEFDEIKSQIKTEVKQCIIKGEKTPEDCLDESIGKFNLSEPDERKIRRALGDNR